MVFISVTRLRIRSFRYLLPFLWNILWTTRQTVRSPGFLGGRLLRDAHLTFWTLTAWEAGAAMRRYRDSGEHRRVMPRLAEWCDEASVVHWTQESSDLPSWQEAHRRMVSEGRLSPLTHPSPNQVARQFAEPAELLSGQILRPVPKP